MKNLKKLGLLALVLTFTLIFCTACGGGDDDKTITVAATPAPHAEILEQVKDVLADEGYTLEIVEFTDYVKPNQAVTDGDADANYFQHQPYLDEYNESNGTDIVSVGAVHYEPLGVYKGKVSSFDALGDGAVIAVPNDTTNEARALQLLAANGVITLKEGAGLEATANDIVDNPKNIEIKELGAEMVASSLEDCDLAVVNGNYALEAGLTAADALVYEASDSEAAETYKNIVAVQSGHEKDAKIQALIKALQSDEVKAFIEEKYSGSIQAAF